MAQRLWKTTESHATSSKSSLQPSPSQSQSVYTTTSPVTITQDSMTLTTSTAIVIGPNTIPTTFPNIPPDSGSSMTSNTDTNTPTSISGTSSTTVPVTITSGSSTFTTSSVSLLPAMSSTDGVSNVAASNSSPICIGQGVDATVIGVLSSLVLSSVIGLILWIIFAYLRPKFRQIYSVREWFVPSEMRPKPLGRSFWAFLWPPVPLVPSVPRDVSSYSSGEHPQVDAALFPSDEELTQRILWHAFLVALGWTVLGIGGALPLYLVDTPCLANSAPSGRFGGKYSTLQDLSVLRLLALVQDNDGDIKSGPSGQFRRRGVMVDDADFSQNTEIRLIVLTVLVIALAAAPAVFKLLHEYTRLVTHQRHWANVRCGSLEMGWLSSAKARGFNGWGEGQLKDFITKIGLSKGFKNSGAPREGYAGVGAYGRSARDREEMSEEEEKARSDVDLQGLFTIADTTRLAGLIAERDITLNNLEVAETQYINSFKLSTPLPSVVDYQVHEEPQVETDNSLKQRIGRPRALTGSVKRKRRHPSERVGAPTSYVAPSSYYRLRDVRGVGRMSADGTEDSLAQRISQRVIGSRFQEIHRDSFAFGRIPLGSHVQLDDRTGSFEPVQLSEDQLRHGPNDPSSGNEAESEGGIEHHDIDPNYIDTLEARTSDVVYSAEMGPSPEEEWTPTAVGSDREELGARPRPPKQHTPPPQARRSTFAMRPKPPPTDQDEAVQPPHLRLQPQQPFVRPVSGMDHDDLGLVYGDIRVWRSRLKAINAEIADAQADGYSYIADGVHIKGWLLVGRGVRFVPGVQMIEGRSKEDIRYHELQNEEGALSSVAFWTIVTMIGVMLGASLVAVAGLVVGPAPDVAHFLTFLQPLSDTNGIGAGLATTLAPAVAASLFIAIALFFVHYTARFSGAVSISTSRITAFKATFLILAVVCCIWLIACGSVIFALEAFASSAARSKTVASGSVYIAAFLLVLVINVAIIAPALLMLQPLRLWRLLRRERGAVTPRQRFRAIYPRVYDPSYATACCLVAIMFAATFSLIFPLIGPAVCLLLFLTLIAHRYLIGYVYVRTDSGYTGGILQIWLLRCFADLIALQPILLGLIFLTRTLWVLGGVLVGAGVLIVAVVEGYARWKARLPGITSLSPITRDSLKRFKDAAISEKIDVPSEDPSFVSSPRRTAGPPRSSMASVLEMMSLTLAVMPSSSKIRGPVPLPTEDLDDLTATERAARTDPNAPPRLPPLHFMTHSEEMQGILYAPELIAPPPIIWLPNDRSGVSQSEAFDLQRWHDLKTTLDINSEAKPRQSNDSKRRDNSITS